MLTLFKFLVVLIAGTLLGLATTNYVLTRGVSFDEVRAGPWIRWPKSGALEIDPYAHAMLSRTGEVPLGSGEGLSFLARRDSTGAPLDAKCDYVVHGAIPPARYWTLALYTPAGSLVDNAAKRFDFTSSEVLRSADGNFEIAVSRQARPGNWLPIGNVAAFTLALRLYDTLFDFGMAKVEAAALPQIDKGRCE